jgi:hypothetical protein
MADRNAVPFPREAMFAEGSKRPGDPRPPCEGEEIHPEVDRGDRE